MILVRYQVNTKGGAATGRKHVPALLRSQCMFLHSRSCKLSFHLMARSQNNRTVLAFGLAANIGDAASGSTPMGGLNGAPREPGGLLPL